MSNRRIGVYICHCGGNISDYVDVARVQQAVSGDPGVVLAKTAMFSCSDATQQEIVQDIKEQNLDGMVVASCSPKLHLFTFRDVARRAGLNPFQYTQVNIREQCSWTHTDDPAGATEKAIRLVRAGIARTNLTEPLEPIVVNTVPRVLVVGAGIAGLRAALGSADLGLQVYVVESSHTPGGWVSGFGKMYPHGVQGSQLTGQLLEEVNKRKNITLFTGARVVEKNGTIGDFNVRVEAGGREETLNVGSIIVATGFENFSPPEGLYGYGGPGVLTLPEFKALLDKTRQDTATQNNAGPGTGQKDSSIIYNGLRIKNIAYIYCVGCRKDPALEDAAAHCSRYCCNAAVHSAIEAAELSPGVKQFHLYRDMRTYGRYETLYSQARDMGSVFIKFDDSEAPAVAAGDDGGLVVATRDLLTFGEELEIPADLVVLVTGMVPRPNAELTDILKIPLGKDKFYNEIHPKLRPVETVVDGIFICGTCQGPKNSSESVASALSAVSQSAALLKKGYVELEPMIAMVDADACTGCGRCLTTCPYMALEEYESGGRGLVRVNTSLCKGCGGCVPLCPENAINLKGYTDSQMRSMIDAFVKETVING